MRFPNVGSRRTLQHCGFTLIELMVTLTLLAILLSLAVPPMARFLNQWQVTNATNAFTGSLRTARAEAISRGKPVVLCRVANNTSNTCLTSVGTTGFASGWIVFVNYDNDANSNYDPNGGDELLLRQDVSPGIESIEPKTGGKYAFLPNGLLRASSFNGINVTGTSGARRGFCISKAGRVRYVADSVDCTT